MNLWVINQFAASGNYSTGAGERHYFLAQEYLKHDIDTTIFSGSYNHLFHNYPEFKGRGIIQVENEVRFCWVKVPKYKPESALGRITSWFWFFVNLFLINKSQIPKPDVIIVSSMSMFPILYALLYRFSHPHVRVIFEVRDIWPKTLLEMSNISKYNPMIVLMGSIEKLAYRKSNMVISVLPFADEHINSVVGREVKFRWIPNGINAEAMTLYPLPVKAKEFFPKNKFIITYTGAIGPANAMEFFAEAIEALTNTSRYHINIIGEGPDKKILKRRLDNLDFVHFISRIKKEIVHSYLNESDILYIGWRDKSIYEFGVSANKYNDYMLAAKPILSSSSFPGDPVDEANCGVVVRAESSQDIKAGIEYLHSLSKEQRISLGKNGLRYVKRNREFSVLANQYIHCFEAIK